MYRWPLTYLLTYLLTPLCRVVLEKPTGLQLVKKFPAFYGTRRFITALTSVRHLSLSWASPIQSPYTHPTFWRSILILSTHLQVATGDGIRKRSEVAPIKRVSMFHERYIWHEVGGGESATAHIFGYPVKLPPQNNTAPAVVYTHTIH